MKTRPISFSASMVRALREGRKTQTRRIVKGVPDNAALHTYYGAYTDGRAGSAPRPAIAHTLGWFVPEAGDLWPCNDKDRIHCPYGQPGDRLWVKEAWRTESDACNDLTPSQLSGEETILYEADGEWPDNHTVGRYRHARFMPERASRILLEITAVRVERLQDISEADAIAEGATLHEKTCTMYDRIYRDAYCRIWESIKGAGSWDANPWIWVIEFKEIKQ